MAEPKVLSPTESIQVAPAPDFAGPARDAAMTPSTLGEFGLNVAQKASQQQATMLGLQQGQDPQGDLFPAITESDEHFKQAYQAQSQATLGLQANELINKSQLALASADKLTPELIQTYRQQVAEGLQDITSAAPMGVKENLENQFGEHLLSSTQQFTMQMMRQNKIQAKQEIQSSNSQNTLNIFNSALLGDEGQAQALHNAQETELKTQFETGKIDRKEYEATKEANELAYYTGKYSFEADKATKEGRIAEWMKSFGEKQLAGLSPANKEQVAKGVMAHIIEGDRWNSKNEALTLSQLKFAGATNQLSSGMLQDAEEQFKGDPNKLLDFKTSYINSQRRQSRENVAVAQSIHNPTDSDSYSVLTPQQKNNRFDELLNVYVQQNKNTDPWQAKTIIAMSTPGEVPAFTQQLNGRLKSRDPNAIRQASVSYNMLHEQNSAYTQNVGENEKARLFAFEANELAGQTPEEAAENSYNAIYAVDDAIGKARKQQWSAIEKKQFPTIDNKVSFAQKHTTARGEITNPSEFGLRFNQMLKANYQITGDYDAALNKTSHDIDTHWGESYINGQRQFVFASLEKTTGIDSSNIGLLQIDAKRQFDEQMAPTKKAYDNGVFPFYYRLKSDQSLDDVVKMKQKISQLTSVAEKGVGDPKVKAMQELWQAKRDFKQVLTGQDMTVERVYRNGDVESFQMQINSGPNISFGGTGENPTVGGYDIAFRGKNNVTQPITGTNILMNRHVSYRPNLSKVKSVYGLINNINDTQAQVLMAQNKAVEEKKGQIASGRRNNLLLDLIDRDHTITSFGASLRNQLESGKIIGQKEGE